MRRSYVTGIVIAVVSLAGCFLGTGTGSPGSKPPADKTAVFLSYNNAFDQPGDDTGGAKVEVDIPLTWTGTRSGGEGAPGDSFTQNTTWHGFATDPWNTSTVITNLDPGTWNLSVTVNGQPFNCASPFNLTAGVQHSVAFQIDKVTGQFAGCTGN
jgi:hypothetical protein